MREWVINTSFSIYEFLYPALGIAFLIVFLILIPLGLFDSTRKFSANALYLISFLFGFAIWVYSAGIAFALLGLFWLIVGLLLAGIGVVAVAFLGALFQGYTSLALGIFLSGIFPIILRMIANYLFEKEKKLKMQSP